MPALERRPLSRVPPCGSVPRFRECSTGRTAGCLACCQEPCNGTPQRASRPGGEELPRRPPEGDEEAWQPMFRRNRACAECAGSSTYPALSLSNRSRRARALVHRVESPGRQDIAPDSKAGAYSCRSSRMDSSGICSKAGRLGAREAGSTCWSIVSRAVLSRERFCPCLHDPRRMSRDRERHLTGAGQG
jgi:hypothetical protein